VLRLGLSGRARLLLLLIDLLDLRRLRGLGGSGGLGLLGSGSLLLGRGEDDRLLDERGLAAEDSGELGLVNQSVEVAHDVGVRRAELGIEDLQGKAEPTGWVEGTSDSESTHQLESTAENAGDEDVGERDAVSNEEGLVGKEVLKVCGLLEDAGLGRVDASLVVGGLSGQRAEPATEADEKGGVRPWEI
jgi:hypothetical protein